MAALLIEKIESSISTPRLERYQQPGGTDLDMVANCFWNMALAESLFCCLSAVEIALRNTLYVALKEHFGPADWYDRKGLLEPDQIKQVKRAKERIDGRKDTVTPGRIVGELNFGFWVTILSRNYDGRLWSGAKAVSLKRAFPRVPRRMRRRVQIHQRYNDIRDLRNRAFHHDRSLTIPTSCSATKTSTTRSTGSIRICARSSTASTASRTSMLTSGKGLSSG